MVDSRSDIGSKIHPYELTDADHIWIGRLIRATAEIEDIIKEHVCRLAELPMGAATILLGRTSTSARLSIARSFAQARGGDTLKAHVECFENDAFRALIKCRNTVAHGVLLGKTDLGAIAFEVQETQGIDADEVVVSAISYQPVAFEFHAEVAERAIPKIEDRLDVKTSRAARRAQPLHPHLKAQYKSKRD